MPNQDASGRSVLTLQSTFLEVGDARWRFALEYCEDQGASPQKFPRTHVIRNW